MTHNRPINLGWRHRWRHWWLIKTKGFIPVLRAYAIVEQPRFFLIAESTFDLPKTRYIPNYASSLVSLHLTENPIHIDIILQQRFITNTPLSYMQWVKSSDTRQVWLILGTNANGATEKAFIKKRVFQRAKVDLYDTIHETWKFQKAWRGARITHHIHTSHNSTVQRVWKFPVLPPKHPVLSPA
jgi:hypothetical protein